MPHDLSECFLSVFFAAQKEHSAEEDQLNAAQKRWEMHCNSYKLINVGGKVTLEQTKNHIFPSTQGSLPSVSDCRRHTAVSNVASLNMRR